MALQVAGVAEYALLGEPEKAACRGPPTSSHSPEVRDTTGFLGPGRGKIGLYPNGGL